MARMSASLENYYENIMDDIHSKNWPDSPDSLQLSEIDTYHQIGEIAEANYHADCAPSDGYIGNKTF